LCEANQWPEDERPYFGDGDEFHMGFHFPIMPRIYMALKKERADDMVGILNRTPPIPENCQWCVFLRNHDELTLEMVTAEERQWMWETYAPEQRMRLNLGIRRRLAPLLDNDRRKIELAYSLLFTLPGSPILYYGDEIGMGDNIWLTDRNGVRTPMQWEAGPTSGFSEAGLESWYSPTIDDEVYEPLRVNVQSQVREPRSLWHTIQKMIAVRKKYHSFGQGEFKWMEAGTNVVAAYQRRYKNETILALHNLGTVPVDVKIAHNAVDILSGEHVTPGTLTLAPLQYRWLLTNTLG
jgi:maltose alpha-D-glucosyltransferase/alpha-amylase